jgi:hypothetical protein
MSIVESKSLVEVWMYALSPLADRRLITEIYRYIPKFPQWVSQMPIKHMRGARVAHVNKHIYIYQDRQISIYDDSYNLIDVYDKYVPEDSEFKVHNEILCLYYHSHCNLIYMPIARDIHEITVVHYINYTFINNKITNMETNETYEVSEPGEYQMLSGNYAIVLDKKSIFYVYDLRTLNHKDINNKPFVTFYAEVKKSCFIRIVDNQLYLMTDCDLVIVRKELLFSFNRWTFSTLPQLHRFCVKDNGDIIAVGLNEGHLYYIKSAHLNYT